jgi:hypothetical protein
MSMTRTRTPEDLRAQAASAASAVPPATVASLALRQAVSATTSTPHASGTPSRWHRDRDNLKVESMARVPVAGTVSEHWQEQTSSKTRTKALERSESATGSGTVRGQIVSLPWQPVRESRGVAVSRGRGGTNVDD